MNGQNRCRGLTCGEEQEPPQKKHKNKKTKKGRHLTMLGISGGEQGYPIGLKFFGGTVGPNVMADDNPDDYRTSGSWATTP